MAEQEIHGTLSVSDAPTTTKHVIRLTELDARSTTDRARANHTGTQSADTVVDGTNNKVLTAAMASKLAGIAAGATANSSDATLLARANHTGTQSADTIVDGTNNKVLTSAMATKLAGIASGATANDTDANLRARANHTGTQPASTISDFTTQVNALIQNVIGAAPTALDTLVELASALGNDANFAATVNGQITSVSNRVTTLEGQSGASNAFKTNIGDGTATVFTITHNKNTQDTDVTVYRVSDGQTVYPVVKRPPGNLNTVTVDFGTTVPANNAYRVIVNPR